MTGEYIVSDRWVPRSVEGTTPLMSPDNPSLSATFASDPNRDTDGTDGGGGRSWLGVEGYYYYYYYYYYHYYYF